MTKIAVIKIGARIAWGARDTAAGNAEARFIIEMLRLGGADVHVYTKTLDKDENPNYITFHELTTEYSTINDMGFDSLVVLNGNAQFWGGQEAPEQMLNYWLINNFKGQIFYIFCDPALDLKQIWGSVSSKEWGTKWKREDIEITRDDIVYISQPYNLDSVRKLIKRNGIAIKKVVHYPLERFTCTEEPLAINPNPVWDLSYGGTMRGGRRVKKMVKYYYGYPADIRVEMFGKIDPDIMQQVATKMGVTGNPPVYSKSVDFSRYMKKVNESMCHVVIGDQWYEGNDMPQRCYQSIWGNVVTFIDIELDPNERIFGKSDMCRKFNYVSSRIDVEKRIRALKNNPSMRILILKEQFKCIDFNTKDYCLGLLKILETKEFEKDEEVVLEDISKRKNIIKSTKLEKHVDVLGTDDIIDMI